MNLSFNGINIKEGGCAMQLIDMLLMKLKMQNVEKFRLLSQLEQLNIMLIMQVVDAIQWLSMESLGS